MNGIHLITATPYDDFWKKMKTLGFNKLKNLRPEINEIPPPEELINSYMKLQDHNMVGV